MKKLLASAVLAGIVSASSVFAQNIAVTWVTVDDRTASVVINEVIQISEIGVEIDGIEFPVHITSSGDNIPQVSFRTPEDREVVEEAIRSGRPSGESSKRINYKITSMTPFTREGSSLKAFASVTFNGVLDIECRVMQSQRDGSYWIAWPSRPPDSDKGERSWVDQVTILNRRVKEIVETDLVETYENTAPAVPGMTTAAVKVSEGPVSTPLTVTAVSVERTSDGNVAAVAQVDLNYSIRIFDVKLYERRGEAFVEFPARVSPAGREFDQMRIFSRELRNEIRRAVETGNPSENKYAEIGFEITKFEQARSDSALKYFCAVTINQALEIECAIIDGSGYDAFVSWPSERIDGAYIDQIVPCNSEARDAMEKALLDRYREESGAR